MPKESFLLLSLNESKAKKIAQVVSNESCRKILDYLSSVKSATETKIAEQLKIPLSTVHYNLKQLCGSKLVDVEEFHYSEKGKEVNHYTLANKYIIIAPRESESFKEKLKKLLPAFGIIAVGSLIMQFGDIFLRGVSKMIPASTESLKAGVADTSVASAAAAQESARIATQATGFEPGLAFWFFIGGISALLIYFVIDWLKNK